MTPMNDQTKSLPTHSNHGHYDIFLSHFSPYLHDSLIKSLYWKNLIKKDSSGKNLIWRCELLKSVGRKILEIE